MMGFRSTSSEYMSYKKASSFL